MRTISRADTKTFKEKCPLSYNQVQLLVPSKN